MNLNELIERYNGNLELATTNDLRGIYLDCSNFTNIQLPTNPEFFQLIHGKKVYSCKLPPINFNNYNIADVCFEDTEFSDGTIFSDDFFYKIRNRTLTLCKLPFINFNGKIIDGVRFNDTQLHPDTIFSNDFFIKARIDNYKMKKILLKIDFSNVAAKDVFFQNISFSEGTRFTEEFFRNNKFNCVSLPPINFNNFNVDDFLISGLEFSEGTIFPRNFFQRIRAKYTGCRLPNLDLSTFELTGVDFRHSAFEENTILPNDFFQMIYDKNVQDVKLPNLDLSNYDVNDVDFRDAVFKENTVLPLNFFQVIRNKSVEGTKLPTLNLEDYDINGVRFSESTSFTLKSRVSLDIFEKYILKENSYSTLIKLNHGKVPQLVPFNALLSIFDNPFIRIIDLTGYKLTDDQLALLYNHYSDKVSSGIMLLPSHKSR